MSSESKTIIVDIDGTISTSAGRGWYEYSRVSEDKPLPHIISLVQLLYSSGHKIVFCTGREDSCEKATIAWIRKHVFMDSFAPIEIYMRRTGDRRPDYIIKREIFTNIISPRHNVWFVIDDRPSVVEMWRSVGLTCLQVHQEEGGGGGIQRK